MQKVYYIIGAAIGVLLIISFLVTSSTDIILSVLGMVIGGVLGVYLQSLGRKKQGN